MTHLWILVVALCATVLLHGNVVVRAAEVLVLPIGNDNNPLEALDPWKALVWVSNSTMSTTTKPVPVVFFVSAFGGMTDIEVYNDVFTGLAEQLDCVVFGISRKFALSATIDYAYYASTLLPVIAFIETDLESRISTAFGQGVLANKVLNTNQLIIAGHSAGNHITVQYIRDYECANIGGVIMMSPVDGQSPFDEPEGDEAVIDTKRYLPFDTPALHLMVGLDPVAESFGPACAPENLSNDRFFQAWQGRIFQINSLQFGHLDILDNNEKNTFSSFCAATKLSETKRLQYVSSMSKAMALFIEGLTTNDESLFQMLMSRDAYQIDSIELTSKEYSVAELTLECLNQKKWSEWEIKVIGISAGSALLLGGWIFFFGGAVVECCSGVDYDSDDDVEPISVAEKMEI